MDLSITAEFVSLSWMQTLSHVELTEHGLKSLGTWMKMISQGLSYRVSMDKGWEETDSLYPVHPINSMLVAPASLRRFIAQHWMNVKSLK